MPTLARGEVANYRLDGLTVRIFENRRDAGEAAATAVASDMRLFDSSQTARLGMVFASAPSQLELLAGLRARPELPWQRVSAFHLDEYVGIAADATQSFGRFLRKQLFEHVPLAEANYLSGQAEPDEECRRYAALLKQKPLSIACIGIGENGHIAFNEPGDTDFADERLVRPVELDEASRQQQVNEGLFARLEEVPTRAITLTVPAITATDRIHCIVPGSNKAVALQRALEQPVGPDCPASVLRGHGASVLYLDEDAAALLSNHGGR